LDNYCRAGIKSLRGTVMNSRKINDIYKTFLKIRIPNLVENVSPGTLDSHFFPGIRELFVEFSVETCTLDVMFLKKMKICLRLYFKPKFG
jgi:hypothetical protein